MLVVVVDVPELVLPKDPEVVVSNGLIIVGTVERVTPETTASSPFPLMPSYLCSLYCSDKITKEPNSASIANFICD